MKTVKLEVPAHLWEVFHTFVDFAQSQFTEEDIKGFSKEEKELIEFIDNVLKNKKSQRYKSNKEKSEAQVGLAALAGL